MGGLSVWFVCVWFEVYGWWLVCGWVVWGGCVCGWCVCCVGVDFEMYLRMIDLCGKHSQVGIFGWRSTIVK